MNEEIVSLASLLSAERAGDRAVAFDDHTVRDWAGFRAHVGSLARRVESTRVERWLVFFDDAYSFAVALFAVAHAGGVAVLPPNGQEGTLARLAERAGGFLTSTADAVSGAGAVIDDPLAGGAPASVAGSLDAEMPFVELFTSGSSGAGKCIAKRLRHLDEEVAVLERTFGGGLGDARFFGTVSHQHIYGALFRVLWPLATGRAFSSPAYLHGGEVAARMAGQRAVLVSSPVQLRAMTESRALAGAAPQAIFSSGAPLDAAVAEAVAAASGTPVTEIFGSTETGGVAWRRAVDGGDWRAFVGVEIGADAAGRLTACSRLVSTGDPVDGGRRRFAMGDRVELCGGGVFRLHGRADRIVKIASKRLSLPEMEAELVRHVDVAEAALAVVRRGIESRVAAAVVLAPAGAHRLEQVGRAEMCRQLGASLAPYFDRVLLPRQWRFVDALPRDPQGKLPESELLALFAADALDDTAADEPQYRRRDPIIEAETSGDDSLRRRCVVPDDLAYFDGHFDGLPIVPGVVQLRWVVDAAQSLLGDKPRIASVEALKFHRPLGPGACFELEVRLDVDRTRLHFRLQRDGDDVSAGRIVLR